MHDLSKLSQSELTTHILWLSKEVKRLEKAMSKAEESERNYSAKNESRSWTYSEQYDKTKMELKQAVERLI